ncbi:MAG TPA: fumarate reductase subunit FrdD [Burkholderiales bacterium]
MDPRPLKRSNKPIFWSLFGAGGMLAALIGPALIFITGFAAPLHYVDVSYERVHAFAAHGLGKIVIVAVIGLFLFHGLHRMYHGVHDFGIHVGPAMKAAFHGVALAGTLIAAALVLALR